VLLHRGFAAVGAARVVSDRRTPASIATGECSDCVVAEALTRPELNAVELMSCGETDDGVIEALMSRMPQYGLVPFHVRRESDGFISTGCGRRSSVSA
jgi:hypothetical protein